MGSGLSLTYWFCLLKHIIGLLIVDLMGLWMGFLMGLLYLFSIFGNNHGFISNCNRIYEQSY
jgi:hypothetical protein